MIQRYQAGSRMSQAVAANGFVFIAGQVADDRHSTASWPRPAPTGPGSWPSMSSCRTSRISRP
jgi:hypothetical protein